MSDRAKSWFARWKMGQNLKNSYLHHRGVLGPHIWGGEPWPTYLSNDPKLERFRDFATPNFTAPTIITTVKLLLTNQVLLRESMMTSYRRLTRNWPPLIGHFWIYLAFLVKIISCNTSYLNTLNYPAVHRIWKIGRKNKDSMCKWQLNGCWSLNKPKNPVTGLYYIRM